jgi:hypothetical protein
VLPFLISWLAIAALTHRFVTTWLVGVTAGVVIRMVVLSHYRWSELSFLAVSLAFVGAVAGLLHFCYPRRTTNGAPQPLG